jgi:hypothetical protein
MTTQTWCSWINLFAAWYIPVFANVPPPARATSSIRVHPRASFFIRGENLLAVPPNGVPSGATIPKQRRRSNRPPAPTATNGSVFAHLPWIDRPFEPVEMRSMKRRQFLGRAAGTALAGGIARPSVVRSEKRARCQSSLRVTRQQETTVYRLAT